MKKGSEGFTLIELMIVVAIVGVLAVLAVYGVSRYLRHAKTAEATNQLGAIEKAASAQFERDSMVGTTITQGQSAQLNHALCGPAGASVPTAATAIQGKKYQSSPDNWTNNNVDSAAGVGFPCLRFQIDDPQYYMYMYTATATTGAGATWTATANGDLNGDTTLSTFSITGTIAQNGVLNNAPNLTISNEDE
jgi:type IV pilus assembly protein PilA